MRWFLLVVLAGCGAVAGEEGAARGVIFGSATYVCPESDETSFSSAAIPVELPEGAVATVIGCDAGGAPEDCHGGGAQVDSQIFGTCSPGKIFKIRWIAPDL